MFLSPCDVHMCMYQNPSHWNDKEKGGILFKVIMPTTLEVHRKEMSDTFHMNEIGSAVGRNKKARSCEQLAISINGASMPCNVPIDKRRFLLCHWTWEGCY